MADNTTLDPGTGGDVIATDDIGGVKHQRVKLEIGADGSASDVHSGNPLPVSDAGGSLTVDKGADATHVTEDAAAVANPSGPQVMVRTRSTPGVEVSTSGDHAALSGPVEGGVWSALLGDGIPAERIGGTTANGLDVDVTRVANVAQLPAALVGGRLDVRLGASAVILGVTGADNRDSPISSGPVLAGARASTALPTPVTGDGDAVDLWATRNGALKATIVDDAGDSVMDGSNDAVRVNVVAGAAGGVSHVDDAAFTPASSAMVPAGGLFLGTRDLVDDGDAGALAMTQRRALLVALESPNGDSLVDDTSDALKVVGAVAMDASVANVAPVIAGARAADSPLSAVSADGDAVPLRADRLGQLCARLVDAAGDSCMDEDEDALRVVIAAGGGSGGTAMADDSAFTPGTTNVTPCAGTYQSTRDLVDDGDAGALAMTQRRALLVALETPNGDSCMDETNDAVRASIVGAVQVGHSFTESFADIDANGETVTSQSGAGSSAVVEITGTWVGTLEFEARAVAGWHPVLAYPLGSSGPPVTSTTGNGAWQVDCAGCSQVRVRASAWTSGTATIIHNRQPGAVSRAHVGARLVDDAGDSCMDGANDALRVNVVAGGAGGGDVQGVDAHDAALTADPLTVGGYASSTAPTNVSANGDAVRAWFDLSGRLQIGDGGQTLSVDDGGASLTVDGSVSVAAALPAGDNNIGNVDVVSLPALPAGSNNIGDVDVLSLPALPAGSNNIGDVDVLSVVPGTGPTSLGKAEDAASGSGDTGVAVFAVRRNSPANSAGSDNDYCTLNCDAAGRLYANVAGAAAHDAAVAGDPVLNGFEARTTAPTAVGNGDAVRAQADSLGKQVVLNGAPHELDVRGNITRTNDTAADIIAAGGAGVKIVVTNLVITNHHATQGTKVEIRSATTVLMIVSAAPVGGGVALANPRGILKSAANEAITGRCVTSGADVEIFASGYTITNG